VVNDTHYAKLTNTEKTNWVLVLWWK